MAHATHRLKTPAPDLTRAGRTFPAAGKLEFYNDGEFVTHDRRRTPRYQFDTAIGVEDTTARTLDLSGNGMLFETLRAFEPGDSVALVFPLEKTGPGACVTCNAKVVRVEPRGNHFAVAVTYEPVAFSVTA
jgi:hypothetical protein